MAQTKQADKSEPSSLVSHPASRIALGLVLLLFAVFITVVSICPLIPPDAVPANAPLTEFSSGRAMKHLSMISTVPHPAGSPAHTEVRNYILKELSELGLRPEIQETGAVTNIFTSMKGKGEGKALLFVGHYDTVADSPGASDDGSAVALMLETIRALKAGAPLNNDLVFLFSDGEEIGRLGAIAFVYQHPSAQGVGLVLNFEARGVSGPSIMFESSDENGWLIRQFAKAAPHPVANSLSYDIYRLLPNDTDLTVFKEAGFAGLNFAFINGSRYYHTRHDDLEHIDERSLQHQGANALALAQHFGNLDLTNVRDHNVIYFNLLNSIMIIYSQKLVLPLAAFVTMLFLILTGMGLRTKRLTLKGVGLGFNAFLSSLAIALCLSVLISLIAGALPGTTNVSDYSALLLVISIVLIIAVTTIIYLRIRERISIWELITGGLCWWLILMLLTSLFLKGGSYLFIWPLLFGTLASGLMFLDREQTPLSIFVLIALALCAAPAFLLIPPLIYLTFMALTIHSFIFSIILATSMILLVVSLIPLLYAITGRGVGIRKKVMV